ncbi:MAG TPA: hypothetical protein DDZ91_12015 [Firmicutes bacterium]|nr:hypothetical protein [Bacillota bacterium]
MKKHCLLLLLCFMLYTIPAAALDTDIDCEAILDDTVTSELSDDNTVQTEPGSEPIEDVEDEPITNDEDSDKDQANVLPEEIASDKKDTEKVIDENANEGVSEDTTEVADKDVGENIEDIKNESQNTPPVISEKPVEIPVIQEFPDVEFYEKTNLKITSETQIKIELNPRLTQLSPVQGGENIIIEIFSDNNLVGSIENGIVTYAIDFLPDDVYITIAGPPGTEFNIVLKFAEPAAAGINQEEPIKEEQICEQETLPEENASEDIDIVPEKQTTPGGEVTDDMDMVPEEQTVSEEKNTPGEEPDTLDNSEENTGSTCGNGNGETTDISGESVAEGDQLEDKN